MPHKNNEIFLNDSFVFFRKKYYKYKSTVTININTFPDSFYLLKVIHVVFDTECLLQTGFMQSTLLRAPTAIKML